MPKGIEHSFSNVSDGIIVNNQKSKSESRANATKKSKAIIIYKCDNQESESRFIANHKNGLIVVKEMK